MTAHFCPHCGYNLTQDEPIAVGEWSLEPGIAYRHGERLRVPPGMAAFLYTLAKAAGRCVSRETIGIRLSTAGEPVNLATVYACRWRRLLGDEAPFETVHGLGYRWVAPMPAAAAA